VAPPNLAYRAAGILDQGTECLQVFDEQEEDRAYPAALDTINNMGNVVDALFTRSQKLAA
jgi:26S proteasome regulatory subunit N6